MAKTLPKRKRLNWRDGITQNTWQDGYFAIVVHGDAEGIVEVKRALSDWLTSMDLKSAGATAELSRYIGYWKPYATSHEDLDRDIDLQEEVRLTALTLIKALKADGLPPWSARLQQKYECRVRNEY